MVNCKINIFLCTLLGGVKKNSTLFSVCGNVDNCEQPLRDQTFVRSYQRYIICTQYVLYICIQADITKCKGRNLTEYLLENTAKHQSVRSDQLQILQGLLPTQSSGLQGASFVQIFTQAVLSWTPNEHVMILSASRSVVTIQLSSVYQVKASIQAVWIALHGKKACDNKKLI